MYDAWKQTRLIRTMLYSTMLMNSHVALLYKHDAERIRTMLYYISTMLKNLYDALLYKNDTTAKLIEMYDALLYKHVIH